MSTLSIDLVLGATVPPQGNRGNVDKYRTPQLGGVRISAMVVSFRFVVSDFRRLSDRCHWRSHVTAVFYTPIDSPRSWSGGWIRKNSRPMPNPRDSPTLAGATYGRSSSPVSRLGGGRSTPLVVITPWALPPLTQCRGSDQCSLGHRGRCSGLTPPPTCCPVRVSGLGSHVRFLSDPITDSDH